jgi:phosphoribosylformimino-5-aminoimidazole carboxamide ribotide isomerase
MLVPSIDLEAGNAVQLVGGEAKALDAGDPRPLARRFGRVGEVAVVDLDAALGRGGNAAVIEELIDLAPCRVGGGIRDVAAAIRWLDRGAHKVVLGTAARPEILGKLPRERVIAALDARHGEVVVEGWQKPTGAGVLERIAALRELAGGFLVTFVEREGRLEGTDLELARKIREAAGGAAVTIAGGITTADELRELDRLGCDAQVGMALYTGRLGLAEAFAAPLQSDRPDGLWPTVVVDERGTALGLCFSNLESLAAALERGQGVYHSRRRGLWVKGETSGAVQELLAVDADCDRDALRFTVRQQPPCFCHLDTRTCWGPDRGLGALSRRLAERKVAAPAGSYTARLFADPDLLGAKLREEAAELAEAESRGDVVHEAADVLYFTLATLARHGVELAEVEAALDRRALKVTRRD